MYYLWAIKWLCRKARDSELHNLWQNIYGSDSMEKLPSKPSSLRTRLEQKPETVTKNTTPNNTIIKPTYIKLAQPKS